MNKQGKTVRYFRPLCKGSYRSFYGGLVLLAGWGWFWFHPSARCLMNCMRVLCGAGELVRISEWIKPVHRSVEGVAAGGGVWGGCSDVTGRYVLEAMRWRGGPFRLGSRSETVNELNVNEAIRSSWVFLCYLLHKSSSEKPVIPWHHQLSRVVGLGKVALTK